MCAASVKNCGPCLISHCLCEWIIKMKYSHECIEQMFFSGDQVKNKCRLIIVYNLYISILCCTSIQVLELGPLLKLLPHSLNRRHLLVNCAWQAGYATNVSFY